MGQVSSAHSAWGFGGSESAHLFDLGGVARTFLHKVHHPRVIIECRVPVAMQGMVSDVEYMRTNIGMCDGHDTHIKNYPV